MRSHLGILKVPRAGGAATTIYSGEVDSGTVSDGTSLFFIGPSGGGAAVFKIAKTGGTPTLVVDRGNRNPNALRMSGGDLYWLEQDGPIATADYAVQKLANGATEPTLFATIPVSLTPNYVVIAGDKGVFADISNTLSGHVDLYSVVTGAAPVRVAMAAGAPVVVSPAGLVYYNSTSGLMRSTPAFDNPTVVSGSSGRTVSAIAFGPTDVWYADQATRCLYKAPI